jgi:hypothetical protein
MANILGCQWSTKQNPKKIAKFLQFGCLWSTKGAVNSSLVAVGGRRFLGQPHHVATKVKALLVPDL